MANRVRVKSASFPRVRHTGKTYPTAKPEEIAHALGAQETQAVGSVRGSPHAMLALREKIASRLLSSGGRPSLQGATKRQKIPMTEEDWSALESIAARFSQPDRKVSAGQVASTLVHEQLRRIGKL